MPRATDRMIRNNNNNNNNNKIIIIISGRMTPTQSRDRGDHIIKEKDLFIYLFLNIRVQEPLCESRDGCPGWVPIPKKRTVSHMQHSSRLLNQILDFLFLF